ASRGARQELRHLLSGERPVRAGRDGAVRLALRARLRARGVQHRRGAGRRRRDHGDDATPMKWTIFAVAVLTIARIAWVNALPQQTYFAKYQYFADRAIAGHLDKDRLPDLSPGYLWFVVAL